MPSGQIQIEQQCHGYKGGHQLLASSTKLSRQDQDAVDRLSDISGPLRPNEKFSPYLTAYPLPSGEFYVLARTWQDLEARRAGCVLTRSFLIRSQDWAGIEDVAGLIQRLKRVDRNSPDADSFSFWSSPAKLLPKLELSQTIEVVEALFLEERQPVVVFGAPDAELLITRLLTALWPGLKRSFSVCSFALGPRAASGGPFDLIFAPKDLRSRFARWEGRRIDGSGDRDTKVRHRWSVATARRIFEDPAPALSKIDALGILATDRAGDESRLRLALLWNDLIDQSIESPTAVLGMLDILHSHDGGIEASNFDVAFTVEKAILNSQAMEPAKRLAFLVPLAIKLETLPVSLSLLVKLCRGLAESSSKDVPSSLRLVNQIIPNAGLIRKVVFAGIARGIATKSVEFLQSRLFSELSDEHLLCFSAVSGRFVSQLVGESPGNSDKGWVTRLAAALAFPNGSFAERAKKRVTSNLTSTEQSSLLKTCLGGAFGLNVTAALEMIWKKTRLSIEAFDVVLLEAITGRTALLQLRDRLLQLPETKATDRLLIRSLNVSLEDLAWGLNESALGETRRTRFLLSILERADDYFLGRLAQIHNLIESLVNTLSFESLSVPQRSAILKLLAWTDAPIDKILPIALPLLVDLYEPFRVEAIGQLVSKGLRAASSGSNRYLNRLMNDRGFSVNPDYLVASAVAPESHPSRISDNLEMLDDAPASVRREVLRYIDNLSSRLIQNRPERLDARAYVAWSHLIADSGDINPIGQLRASGDALSFALSQRDPKVLPIVVVSFPIVYRELKQGKDEPSFWSLFFTDWDRCKTARKEIVKTFVHAGWPPFQFLRTALPTGDVERILQTLIKEDGGIEYLRGLRNFLPELDPTDRDSVLAAVDSLLPGEARDYRTERRSTSPKRKH